MERTDSGDRTGCVACVDNDDSLDFGRRLSDAHPGRGPHVLQIPWEHSWRSRGLVTFEIPAGRLTID